MPSSERDPTRNPFLKQFENGDESEFVARWFDPRDGSFGEAFAATAGDCVQFNAPDSPDWTLPLQR